MPAVHPAHENPRARSQLLLLLLQNRLISNTLSSTRFSCNRYKYEVSSPGLLPGCQNHQIFRVQSRLDLAMHLFLATAFLASATPLMVTENSSQNPPDLRLLPSKHPTTTTSQPGRNTYTPRRACPKQTLYQNYPYLPILCPSPAPDFSGTPPTDPVPRFIPLTICFWRWCLHPPSPGHHYHLSPFPHHIQNSFLNPTHQQATQIHQIPSSFIFF
jgi:hypothetical protein